MFKVLSSICMFPISQNASPHPGHGARLNLSSTIALIRSLRPDKNLPHYLVEMLTEDNGLGSVSRCSRYSGSFHTWKTSNESINSRESNLTDLDEGIMTVSRFAMHSGSVDRILAGQQMLPTGSIQECVDFE